MGDWIGAVSHMLTKIAMTFPPKAGLKHKARGGDPMKISEAGRGRGRGGKGRSGRDARGRGRGGRGESGRGRGGNITTFNGVNTSDHTYNFSDNEMTKMGRDGRTSVFNRRNRDQERNRDGERNRGGGDKRVNPRGSYILLRRNPGGRQMSKPRRELHSVTEVTCYNRAVRDILMMNA